MLASVRRAAARVAFRRGAGVQTLTTNSLATEVTKQTSAIPTTGSATIPFSPSVSTSLSSLASSTQPPVIHIPPAEDPLLHLFTSLVMFDGKRQTASRVVTKMLLHIHAFTKAPPLPILRQAVDTAAPLLRCRQFKRAAKQYVFPMPLSERQRARTAIKWIWEAAKTRGGKHVSERLAREVIAIVKGESEVLKKKSDVHKLAVLHRCVIVSFMCASYLIMRDFAFPSSYAPQREYRQAATSSQVEPELDFAGIHIYLYCSILTL